MPSVFWALICCAGSKTVLSSWQGAGVHPTTALLMVGVLLSGYSAYLSYTYLTRIKSEGLDVLQGWQQMKLFYEHLVVNFAGAAATILALQAEVGSLMLGGMSKQTSGLAIQALAQVRAAALNSGAWQKCTVRRLTEVVYRCTSVLLTWVLCPKL